MLGAWNDIRYAARRLSRSFGFTLAAVLTIALGVGLNTATFSVLNGALLRHLPVPAGEELVILYQTVNSGPGGSEKGAPNPRFTTAELEAFRDRSRTLTGLMGYSLPWPAVLGGAAPRQINGRYVTCGYFDVLRQPPAVGRALTADDCRSGAEPVVMLSHAFWSAHYAADPTVVGRSITMNDQALTVVGIAAADAYQPGLQRLDYFVPITAQPYLRPDREWLTSETTGWLELLGRRGEGSSREQVAAELTVIADAFLASSGRSATVLAELATPTAARKLGANALSSAALVVAVFALVLLVACANVANLFLARAAARMPEIAVRRALGASRGRVVRQLLTEAVLVAGIGGVGGSIVGVAAFDGLSRVLLASSAIALPQIALDVRVLGLALALSLAAGVAAGLAPALGITRAGHAAMRQGAVISSARARGRGRLRSSLIAVQVAACTVLLIGAGLLLRGLYATHHADPGLEHRRATYVELELRAFGYDAAGIAEFQRRLKEQVGALPGVAAVGFVADPPLGGSNMTVRMRAAVDGATWHAAERNYVTADFFAAAGIPLVRGRTFTAAEETAASGAVIVTETTARNLWPGQDPLGQILARGAGDGESRAEVVGIARDAHVAVIGETPPYYVYEPAPPQFRHQLSLFVRSETDVDSMAPGIRAAVLALDPRLAVDVVPIAANIEVWQRRAALVTSLAAAIAALALALAAVGIYGVVAFVVAQRTHEIGLRMALGARGGRVLALILGRTLRPVVGGMLAGLLVAAFASAVLASVLYGVSPLDPAAIGGALAFLLAVAVLASVLPARRALDVEPMATMRYE